MTLTRALIPATVLALAAMLAMAGTAAAGPCPIRGAQDDGIKRVTRDGVTRTQLVTCSAILKEATLRRSGGSLLLAGTSTPDRAAWVLAQVRGGRTRVTVTAVDLNNKRTLSRVTLLSRPGRAIPRSARLVLSTRGDVAATVRTPKGGHRLVVAPARGRARVVVGDGQVRRLALEDDRTFSWTSGSSIAAVDLPVRAVPGRCPQRTGFVVVGAAPGTTVTQREYVSAVDGRYGTMVRACDQASGTDWVVASVADGFSSGGVLTTLGLHGGSVVLLTYTADKYDGCLDTKVEVLDARAHDVRGGVPATSWRLPDCSVADTAGRPRGPLVVTSPRRQVAWVQPGAGGVRLVATSPDGTLRTLDGPGASEITDLRADGETVLWTRDGVQRSAPL